MKLKSKSPVLALFLLLTANVNALELVDCDQLMLISAYWSNNVYAFNACDGEYLQRLDNQGRIQGAQATRVGPDGLLYVASEINGKILRYDGETLAFVDEFAAGGVIQEPTGMAFGPDGNLYVASFSGDKIIKLNGSTGQYMGDFATGIDGPDAGMEFGPDGNLYVPAFYGNSISVFNGQSGNLVKTISGGLPKPRVVNFEPSGNSFLVSTWGTGNIARYSSTGVFQSFLTNDYPKVTGMAHRKDGTLFAIADNVGSARPVDSVTGEIGGDFTGSAGISGATFITFMDFEPGTSGVQTPTNQLWVAGLGEIAGLTISLDAESFIYTTHGEFGDAFDPEKVVRYPFGGVSISLTDCTEATLDYTTAGNAGMGSGGYSLHKIGANITLTECQQMGFDEATTPANALTGAWYGGPERSGEGFFIDVLENGTAVVAWFTYGVARDGGS